MAMVLRGVSISRRQHNTKMLLEKNDILYSTWLSPLYFRLFFFSFFPSLTPNRAHQKRQRMSYSTFGSNSPEIHLYIHVQEYGDGANGKKTHERNKRTRMGMSETEQQLDAIPILCFLFLSATLLRKIKENTTNLK